MKTRLHNGGAQRIKDRDREFIGIILDLFDGPFVMLTACLDESKNGPIFCVTGVLLGRKSLKALDREWKRELKLAGIRYYHAVDCAHGTDEFKGKSKDFRMYLHKRMCEIMRKHLIGSVTVASMPWQYPFKKHDWGYSEYTVCAFLCMDEMFALADRLGRDDSLAFFIEDGHERAGELRKLIQSQLKAGRLDIERYQFVGKQGFRAVQAADVFAYETCKRLAEKSQAPYEPTDKEMRKSLQAIAITGDGRNRFVPLDDEQRQRFGKLINQRNA